ncbi:hypothetical protein M427DRAFT_276940 [Gonapodya prolifera JEL478]|uniref:Zn(2)-C6 fungal-type domain-containing protein n=1 Tax=Gonapodya prolifera (strain JEL478) TaxID=1344416 RepID=A0A139AY84_GONPJ|nr:hypothetical protein M427DRAFT_276940 [Gonapodya prolifera JEL478]|eukprot:KXS21708.1 hypothetical protein M427DRAFT_276940 [Gonapodya prolifera JEL478]
MNESASPRNWRRSTKACDFCVQRKLRCDKSTQDHDARPCSNCLRFGRECKFTKPTLKRGRRAESLSQDASIPPSAQGASTHDATPSGTGHHAEGYGAPMFAGLQVLSSAISMDEGGSSLKYLDRDLPTPPLDLIPHLHDTFVANVHHDFPITPRPPLTFTTRFLSLALCRAAVPFSNHPHLLTPPMSRTHLSLALETHFQDYMKLWISGELPPDLTSVQSLCVMASALSGTAHGDHNKVKRMVGMAVQQAQELDLARGTTREEVLTSGND